MSGPPTGSSPINAGGSIDAGGLTGTALKGIALPTGFHASGSYPFELEHPIDEAECIVLVTFRGAPGLDCTAIVIHTTDVMKEVRMVDGAGIPANAAFDVLFLRVKVGG